MSDDFYTLGHIYTIMPGWIEIGYQCPRCGEEWSMLYQETVLEKTPETLECRLHKFCGGTGQRTFAQRHRIIRPQ